MLSVWNRTIMNICRRWIISKTAAQPIADRPVASVASICGEVPVPVCACAIFSSCFVVRIAAAKALDSGEFECYNVFDNLITHSVADRAMNPGC